MSAQLLSRSVVCDSVTVGTKARQSTLSMGFSRQEYWRGLPFPPPRYLPDSRMEPTTPVSPALTGGFFPTEPPGKTGPDIYLQAYVTFGVTFLQHFSFPGVCNVGS